MPADELDGFPDREQLLGGAPAKRASALLFLIEARTARLVAQSRLTMERFVTDESAQERALDFVEAFALAREQVVRPSIRDLERYAKEWAPLVPENPQLRAALAHRLRDSHRFTARVVPGIRRALGLDDADVREAYHRLYGEPLEAVYASRLTAGERLRWVWTALAKRLESLPPFWTAYSLTLVETLGISILALPIAFAAIGPLAGVVILVALGLVNVLTIAYMAEAVVRSGPMRYHPAFFGRLIADLLGRGGSLALSVLRFAFGLLALPIYYIGFGTTLEEATGVHAAVWVALLFLVGLYYLRPGSLNATVATALAVGMVNLALVLGLSALGLVHVDGGNLLDTELPFTEGRSLEPALFGVVFGVALMAYFGHTSVAVGGSLVLRNDPSGRSLIYGCAAAQATVIVVYCLFVLATIGGVGADAFAGEVGTALSPLADEAGFAAYVLGSAFVILALGMGSIFEAHALFALTEERLPPISPRQVVLPRERARLVFEARRGRLRVGVTYLGSEVGGARFAFDVERDGRLEHTVVVGSGRWEVLPAHEADGQRLGLELVGFDERQVQVAVTSTLRMAYEGDLVPGGVSLSDVLEMPDAEAELVGWLARSGEASLVDVATHTGGTSENARALLESLLARGAVVEKQTRGGPLFAARMAPRRARGGEVWDALVDGGETARRRPPRPSERSSSGRRGSGLLVAPAGRFAVAVVPVLVALGIGEWAVVTGSVSFTGFVGFLGVIVISILAGLYPVLLLISSRRKGEYEPRVARDFGHPVLLGAVYLLFLAGLFAHGLVIWEESLERIAAVATGIVMLALPGLLFRRGAFARRLTVEVRDDQRTGRAGFSVVSGGRPVTGVIRLEYAGRESQPEGASGQIPDFASLHRVVVAPRHEAPLGEVKVWAHRVTPEGETESLPARSRVRMGADVREADLALSRGAALFPVSSGELEIEVLLRQAGERTRG